MRFLADGMLGRLARYLRFLGEDVVYAPDRGDEVLREEARREERCLLTRDRILAARTPGAIYVASPELGAQLRGLWERLPGLSREVRFVRCSACNGPLEAGRPLAGETWPEMVPVRFRADPEPLYRCRACGHWYWEGSHTARIRRTVASFESGDRTP